MSPSQKLPSLTTTSIIMHFDAVLIRESSFNIYFKRFCFWYQAIYTTFMQNQKALIVANIHIEWGRVVFKILRAGRLWGGLTVHHYGIRCTV